MRIVVAALTVMTVGGVAFVGDVVVTLLHRALG